MSDHPNTSVTTENFGPFPPLTPAEQRDLIQQLAAEKSARLKAESACGEMRRLLELLKTGPVFRDEVDHALALLDGKQ